MIQFSAHGFYEAFEALRQNRSYLRDLLIEGSPFAQLQKEIALRRVLDLKIHTDVLELIETRGRVDRYARSLEAFVDGYKRMSVDEMCTEIDGIEDSVQRELATHKFACIQWGKAAYFEQKALFGAAVNKAFPSISTEIKEAGNCLSAGLNTAAVYHLMRVMEFGLRLLHKKAVRAEPGNPNWQNLLDEIEKSVSNKNNDPRPVWWMKLRPFFKEAARHFWFFKEKRNRSVHVELPRDEYVPPSEEDVARIFQEVKGFIQHLATKLKER